MSDPKLVALIERILVTTGQKWKDTEGNLNYPTTKGVEKVLDSLLDTLYDGQGQQAESGGILVQNWYGHFDVYIRIGEIKDDTDTTE